MIYSTHNYWFVLVSDVAGAVGFLVFGIRHLSGSAIAAGLSVTGGFIAWGFLEYALHRWLLHGRPSIARRGHARHHVDRHMVNDGVTTTLWHRLLGTFQSSQESWNGRSVGEAASSPVLGARGSLSP